MDHPGLLNPTLCNKAKWIKGTATIKKLEKSEYYKIDVKSSITNRYLTLG